VTEANHRIIARRVEQERPLRRGWTTCTCAAAAAKAAYAALLGGGFPDPVEIALPCGVRVAFPLAETFLTEEAATADVVKDADDDADATHGALVRATVSRAPPGAGVLFRAGPGVGTITRPGLPLPSGEPAINPVPRQMIQAGIAEVAAARAYPVPGVTVAGGVAKMTKLVQGRLDLHSKRGGADLAGLAALARGRGVSASLARTICQANTVAEAFTLAAADGLPLGDAVTAAAWDVAAQVLRPARTELEIAVFYRAGNLVGRAPFASIHASSSSGARNLRR